MNLTENENLGIVLINYKNENLTIEFVKNELAKIKESKVIIIVNNEASLESNNYLSSNLNATIINEESFFSDTVTSKIFILSSIKNLGFAKGNNLGVKFLQNHFKINFLLFTNNDIIINSEDCVSTLIEKLNNNSQIGVIGPDCRDTLGRSQSPRPFVTFENKYINNLLVTPFISKNKKEELFKYKYPENAKEGFHYKVSGSFFMVNFNDFVNCGMMDPNTFLYCEEEILTERMKKINKKTFYTPTVFVTHLEGNTTKKYISNLNKIKLEFESSIYYYKNYIGLSRLSELFGIFIYILLLKKNH
jgi:GT2 family glycosyltransferase